MQIRFSKYLIHRLLLISFCIPLAVAAAASPDSTAGDSLKINLEKAKGDTPWCAWIADALMSRYPKYAVYDTSNIKWDYDQALVEHALWNVWNKTGDRRYLNYLKRNIDYFLTPDGNLKTYNFNQFRLDDLLHGRTLLDLYKLTGDRKYKNAVDTLRKQIAEQPRTPEGGFWHKEIYPDQMWLDGLYMAEPFYSEYAEVFDEHRDFDDVARQFILMSKNSLDAVTGLIYHGWDYSRKQKWSDSTTGCSRVFWGRAMGWYIMGLVDVLDYFPKDHPDRRKLLTILRNLSESICKFQDNRTHLWYQVVDQPSRSGNYPEASASAMFMYAFAKGATKGYLPRKYFTISLGVFDGLVSNLMRLDSSGLPSLSNVCTGAGLGGDPYRDGSYEYYVSVPKSDDDFKGDGAFILGAVELEKAGLIK
ncbi:MAG TPA: glycoside hydrolase family 88 protein [Candidatus Kryptonia bacterium]